MKKLAVYLILGAMLLALTGCGGAQSNASKDTGALQSADSTPDSSSGDGTEGSFTWPSEIPVDLRSFDGASFSTYARDTFSENAWTMYFECSDKQKVDDYIKRLKDLGYTQDYYSSNDTGLDYNGTGDNADIDINYISGGLSKLYIAFKTTGDNGSSDSSGSASGTSAGSAAWPEEFSKWGVPTIQNAAVSFADNKSATEEGLTQGITAVVNLQQLPKADFEAYVQTLEKKGFEKNTGESLGDVMLIYEKSVTGGAIKMILFYGEDVTTITVSNSAAAAEKDAAAGGSVKWPESAKGIPAFTKGTYKETIELGGGMYAITFIDVKETDLDWYRGVLKKAGFISQEEDDTEGYAKLDKDLVYSVGFSMEGDTLQIVVVSGSF